MEIYLVLVKTFVGLYQEVSIKEIKEKGSTLNSQTPTWDFGDGSPQIKQ